MIEVAKENRTAKCAVQVEELSVLFRGRGGEHLAVDRLSFELAVGESLAVVGQSGSGKTTLLRALLGLVAPASGRVSLFGTDVNTLSFTELASTRQRCGYVPQDPYGALPPGLTALGAVMEPARIAGRVWSKGETRERAVALLAELGLTGERILGSRAVGLSGGQRQRVELARALILEPELLLCDEPTSMQDVSTRGEIIDVLRRHQARGMGMVFVTHDLRLAGRAAQHILVMRDGRKCEEGSSDQILSAPTHPYTKELLDALPKLPE